MVCNKTYGYTWLYPTEARDLLLYIGYDHIHPWIWAHSSGWFVFAENRKNQRRRYILRKIASLHCVVNFVWRREAIYKGHDGWNRTRKKQKKTTGKKAANITQKGFLLGVVRKHTAKTPFVVWAHKLNKQQIHPMPCFSPLDHKKNWVWKKDRRTGRTQTGESMCP
jgi:hypothetical protein